MLIDEVEMGGAQCRRSLGAWMEFAQWVAADETKRVLRIWTHVYAYSWP